MKKYLFASFLICILAGMTLLTGCAHTGLVTGPMVEGPSSDRLPFVDNKKNIQAYSNDAANSHNTNQAMIGNMEVPAELQADLSTVKSGFGQATQDLESKLGTFQSDLSEMENMEQKTFEIPEFEEIEMKELPTYELPELESLNTDLGSIDLKNQKFDLNQQPNLNTKQEVDDK